MLHTVSLSPSSLYPPCIHFAEQYARHLSHSLFTLPPPGALVPRLVARMSHCTRLRHSSLYARPASPSLPCPLTSLPHAGHYAGHCVGKSHACRRHAPGPRCMSLRRTLHLFGGGPLCGSAPRRSALSRARAHCGWLFRLWGTFVLLPQVCSVMPPWHALLPALPSLFLCPPASASTMRSNSRGSAPSLPPLSTPAPWPCPAPCLLALPRPPSPPFPGPLVPGPLSLCPRPPFTLPAYTSRSNTRGTPPTPSSPCRPLVPWSRLHPPAAFGPLFPPYPPLPPLPFSLSTLRRTLRKTLCRQVARMSQAHIWPPSPCPALSPLYTTQDTTQDTV